MKTNTDNGRLEDRIIQKFESVILKLGIWSHVPSTATDEFLEKLHFIFSSGVVPISNSTAIDVFKKHDIHVDKLVIDELTLAIFTHYPLVKAIAKDGPIASAFKCKQYYKEYFKVVEPVEYVFEARSNKSYQYVPLLKSLQQLLGRNDVVDRVVDTHTTCSLSHQKYVSFQDGEHYKNNLFFSAGKLRNSLCLYIDDFEVCNPLGTPRKKHNLSAVYWILGNLPPGSSSTLSSIYLALLCKSEYVKEYGYKKIFEPLLHNIVTLEQQGLFFPQLGRFIKGTLQCVVADNLWAHGLAGFVESFSGIYFCRYCTAQSCLIQTQEVKLGTFEARTREGYQLQVTTAQKEGVSCFGVKKKACVLTDRLSQFDVTRGYPPDIVHDLFEGIVPVELARCITVLLSKKLFTLDHLNSLIHAFPYKWGR